MYLAYGQLGEVQNLHNFKQSVAFGVPKDLQVGTEKFIEINAERCSKVWNSECDEFSKIRDKHDTITEGEKFVARTAEKRYCKIVTSPGSVNACTVFKRPYNPHEPQSTEISSYQGDCEVDCSDISLNVIKEPQFQACLNNFEACEHIIEPLCQSTVSANDAKLRKFCVSRHYKIQENDFIANDIISPMVWSVIIASVILLVAYFIRSK